VARGLAPLFTELHGNEFALVSVVALKDIDPPISLPTLIERLISVPISALAIVGHIDAQSIAVAEQANLPLLHLASDVDIHVVDRELQRLIGDYDAQVDRRAAQIALELGEQSLAGGGFPAMLALLANRTGRNVAIYSVKGDMLSFHGSTEVKSTLLHIALTPGNQRVSGIDTWCLPLTAAGQGIGFIVLAGQSLTDADKATVKRAAMALAMELTKTQALSAVEERYRGNFLEQLLAGNLSDPLVLQQRAREIGVDLRKPHVAMLFRLPLTQQNQLQAQFANALPQLGSTIPWLAHALGVLCFVPADTANSSEKQIIQLVLRDVVAYFPTVRATYGRVALTHTDWIRSQTEAELTQKLLRTNSNVALGYAEIGVYQLLLPLMNNADAMLFHHQHLGALLDYEREQHGELLQTLEAFFDCNGNLARTSEAIHVHRNTLLYRLSRISQICQVDLDNTETRLSLWLAIKLHRLIGHTATDSL
jgi:purine catabolism regulator